VLEDIVLWGVIAIATTIAAAQDQPWSPGRHRLRAHRPEPGLFLLAMIVMPAVLRWLGQARWNTLAHSAPVVWMIAVLFGYVAVAAHFESRSPGGLPVRIRDRRRDEGHRTGPLRGAAARHQRTVAGRVHPLYFAIVGYKLDFTKTSAR